LRLTVTNWLPIAVEVLRKFVAAPPGVTFFWTDVLKDEPKETPEGPTGPVAPVAPVAP
jgi:hypothetical protein